MFIKSDKNRKAQEGLSPVLQAVYEELITYVDYADNPDEVYDNLKQMSEDEGDYISIIVNGSSGSEPLYVVTLEQANVLANSMILQNAEEIKSAIPDYLQVYFDEEQYVLDHEDDSIDLLSEQDELFGNGTIRDTGEDVFIFYGLKPDFKV